VSLFNVCLPAAPYCLVPGEDTPHKQRLLANSGL